MLALGLECVVDPTDGQTEATDIEPSEPDETTHQWMDCEAAPAPDESALPDLAGLDPATQFRITDSATRPCYARRNTEEPRHACAFVGTWKRRDEARTSIKLEIRPDGTFTEHSNGGDFEDEWDGRWEAVDGALILLTDNGCECRRVHGVADTDDEVFATYAEPRGVVDTAAWERTTEPADDDCLEPSDPIASCEADPDEFRLTRTELDEGHEGNLLFGRATAMPRTDEWDVARDLRASLLTVGLWGLDADPSVDPPLFRLDDPTPNCKPSSSLEPGEFYVNQHGSRGIEISFGHAPVLVGGARYQLRYAFEASKYATATDEQLVEVLVAGD